MECNKCGSIQNWVQIKSLEDLEKCRAEVERLISIGVLKLCIDSSRSTNYINKIYLCTHCDNAFLLYAETDTIFYGEWTEL